MPTTISCHYLKEANIAFVPVVISAPVGDKSMGKSAPNKPDDVRKIQALLKRVFGSTPPFVDGVSDYNLKAAIAEFQKLWGVVPDSTVDPHRETLKRLNRLANPLVLNKIAMTKVAEGGYVISFRTCDGGTLPPAGNGYTQLLCFSDKTGRTDSIDVSNRPAHQLLSSDNLGNVLKIFERLGCWATEVQCRIQLRYRGAVISTSDPQPLHAPVQPHNGLLLPLDQVNNGPKLTYQGDAVKNHFHGRMFAQVPGYDKFAFVWAGAFETQNEFRGFDCITYVDTTCGAPNRSMKKSDELADSLSASRIEFRGKPLEQADPAHVKDFFKGTPTGYYLIFSGGHIVLVADGKVHEFKASVPSGYSCKPVTDWLSHYKATKLTVRKLPQKPARAI